jgi:hypothetical protein
MDENQRVKGKKVYVFEEIIKEIEDSGISSICRTINKFNHSLDSANYPKAEAKKIALIRLSQTSIIDNHKFSEHEAFSNFNSVGEENNLIRKYDDFSNILKQEFDEQLGLTEEIYNEIILTKLTNDSIKKYHNNFKTNYNHKTTHISS